MAPSKGAPLWRSVATGASRLGTCQGLPPKWDHSSRSADCLTPRDNFAIQSFDRVVSSGRPSVNRMTPEKDECPPCGGLRRDTRGGARRRARWRGPGRVVCESGRARHDPRRRGACGLPGVRDGPGLPIIRPRAGTFVYDADEIERCFGRFIVPANSARTASSPVPYAPMAPSTVRRWRHCNARRPSALHLPSRLRCDARSSGSTRHAHHARRRRVLTSGGATTALEGVPQIARLVQQAASRLIVIAAGSVRAHNVREIVERTNVQEVHARLKSVDAVRSVVDALRRDNHGTDEGR